MLEHQEDETGEGDFTSERTGQALELVQIFIELTNDDRTAILAYARSLHRGRRRKMIPRPWS